MWLEILEFVPGWKVFLSGNGVENEMINKG